MKKTKSVREQWCLSKSPNKLVEGKQVEAKPVDTKHKYEPLSPLKVHTCYFFRKKYSFPLNKKRLKLTLFFVFVMIQS